MVVEDVVDVSHFILSGRLVTHIQITSLTRRFSVVRFVRVGIKHNGKSKF